MDELSRLENHVLALIRKWQPTTAYFVRKSLGDTLATNVSDSPGSVYPVIERLKRHGLVTGEPAARGRRASEHLACTPAGEERIRAWLTAVLPVDLLPEDPVRTRFRFAGLLDAEARRRWLGRLRQEMQLLLEGLERAAALEADPDRALELEHAKLVSAARIAWVNAALAGMSVSEQPRSGSRTRE